LSQLGESGQGDSKGKSGRHFEILSMRERGKRRERERERERERDFEKKQQIIFPAFG
jgi:hypothetical protein